MRRLRASITAPLLVCFALACVLPRVQALPAGLRHHWNFDEGPDWHDAAFRSIATATVAADSVGTIDATLQNMTGTNWVSGRQFTGLWFDGTADYLQLSGSIGAVLGGPTTFSAWIKTTQSGSSNAAAAPALCGASSLILGAIDDVGRIGLVVDGAWVARSSAPINDDAWHQVAFTRDSSSGFVQIYVDGQVSGSAVGPAGTRANTVSRLGRVEGTARYYQGRLDQVHVYEVVLASSVISQLFDNHAPKVWDSLTMGMSASPFSTESIVFRSYDPDQDAVKVYRWGQGTKGAVAHNGDGTFTYTPGVGASGPDQFTVTVEDGRGGFATKAMKVYLAGASPPGSGNRTTTFAGWAPLDAGGTPISLSGLRCPRLVDWDADGDLDLLVGHSGAIWRYQNTGGPTTPVFAAGVRVLTAGTNISLSSGVTIALADMTGDGQQDLVAVDGTKKIRVYASTAGAGVPPVYAAAVILKTPANADFVMPDQRFDIADWTGDGLPDVIMGNYSGEVRVYTNVGSASLAKYDTAQYSVLESGSYNLYPRVFDISRNGFLDYIRGVNWGNVDYYLDCALYTGLGNRSGSLSILDGSGIATSPRPGTDGAILDFGDLNGDGVFDLVSGGHANTNLFVAFGVKKTVADSLADVEAIYNSYPTNLGEMLETNGQALLNQVRAAENNIINHMFSGSLAERQTMFSQMSNHVRKYAFLQMAASLNVTQYHHLPSIAGQNLLTMHQMLPDTPMHRSNVVAAVGLTGTWREVYLNSSLHVGDNLKAPRGQIESVRDLMKYLPRAIFPDTMITLDHYYGDGRGGHVNSFTSAKNTFNWGEGSDVSEWAGDLNAAVLNYYGSQVNKGDYFTFVMGHEVTHSLDGYVNSRANKDLRRRWGRVLTYAAGADVIPGTNGWIDWTATKANFQAKGFWDGVSANWTPAWSNYWNIGVGKAWRSTSFMRGNIDWFLENSQESLATQANHHHAHSEARLIGALDRYRRGAASGIDPMKANLNEVVHFLDFQSAGLNKVVLYDTIGTNSPYNRAVYVVTHAWLERDDAGYIRKITVGDRIYRLSISAEGIYTLAQSNLAMTEKDRVWTYQNRSRIFDVLANDTRVEGGPVSLLGVGTAVSGTVRTNGDGRVIYTPALNFLGNDTFSYTATAGGGLVKTGMVYVEVVTTSPDNASLLVEYWNNITGSAVTDLTAHSRFPASPDRKYYTNAAFELNANVAESYGTRVRGLLRPTVSGTYTFWIASDDGGELWLSSNASPIARSRVAYTDSWSNPREWTKYASQQSLPVELVAGQSYYIETLQKEGNGGDNLAVGWQPPGGAQGVIPAVVLKGPFWGFTAPVFVSSTLNAAGATAGVAYESSLSPYVLGAVPGEPLAFSKITGPAWLKVSPDGSLKGTPGVGDVGLNSFQVRLVSSNDFLHEAVFQIAVSNPLPGNVQSIARLSDGNLQFTAAGTPLASCRVMMADEVEGDWTLLQEGGFDALGSYVFSDLEVTNRPRRFYRVMSP